jgi:hypothetical protein
MICFVFCPGKRWAWANGTAVNDDDGQTLPRFFWWLQGVFLI